jgi:hypothetical protein
MKKDLSKIMIKDHKEGKDRLKKLISRNMRKLKFLIIIHHR